MAKLKRQKSGNRNGEEGNEEVQNRASKRARQEPMDVRDRREEEDVEAVDEIIAQDMAEEAPAAGPDRREGMADIARRRAAHFALFQADDEEEVRNAHTGGTEARNLGPWSSAMELVDARAAAASARKGRIEAAKAGRLSTSSRIGPQTSKPEANTRLAIADDTIDDLSLRDDHIIWSPKRDVKLGPRLPNTIGTLFQSCLALLVEHIEDVESLWGIPDVIKVRLAAALCEARKLSPEVAELICGGQPDEVVLPDCTQLKEEDFISLLQLLSSSRLESLSLNLCGRGFGDSAAAALAKGNRLENLRVLALGGAYRLRDSGLLEILKAAPNLEELRLPQCCRIQGTALQSLPALTPKLRTLDLVDCRGLSSESLKAILCNETNLGQLEELILDGIAEVDDALITEICLALPLLSRLSIKFCTLVSDEGIRGIAAGCGPRLTELRLDELTKVTDEGMIALSASCLNIQELRMERCLKVTDAGIASIASAGQLRVLGVNKVHELTSLAVKALAATCSEKLEEVDFSWCRKVTANALGLLVDSCPKLKNVILFGCTQAGKSFLNGHSAEDLEIIGAPEQTIVQPEMVKLRLIAEEEEEGDKEETS